MNPDSKIYVAGHRGMVGSAIVRNLLNSGFSNIITQTRQEVDLCNQAAVNKFFETEKPEYVFLAAAKVGGIYANNTYRADFIYQNLMMEANIIQAAYEHNCAKLLFLGSSCIYPRLCPQPIKEEYLLTGALEPTNEPYAIAKIAGLKLIESYRRQHGCNFISCMPTNLYGPNDNYDLNNSHVLPALLRKMHEAKVNKEYEVTVWGDGTPRREFLHVDELARACVFLMENYNDELPLNVGLGTDVSIHELANLIKKVVGFNGTLVFDSTKPNGTPRKLLDVSKLNALGFVNTLSLEEGIRSTYKHFLESESMRAV